MDANRVCQGIKKVRVEPATRSVVTTCRHYMFMGTNTQEVGGCYTLNNSYVHELLMTYSILGNFRVIKGLREKIFHGVKFSRYGPSMKI